MRTAAPTKRSRVNAFQRAAATGLELDELVRDERTASLLERRGIGGDATDRQTVVRRRGWLVRRALLAADVGGLVCAFLLAYVISPDGGDTGVPAQFGVLLLTIPLWVVAAKLYGLYERDEENVDHSTIDELVGVFHLVTLGAWFYFVATWLVGVGNAHVPRLVDVLVPRDDPRRGVSRRSRVRSRGGARSTCRTP